MKKMIIAGYIGNDAEIRQKTNSKDKFVTLSVAVDESYIDKETKEKVKRTDWISIIMNYDRFKKVSEYLKKGAYCTIIGKPMIHKYKNDKGEILTNFRLIADEIDFFNPKPKVIDKETGEIV